MRPVLQRNARPVQQARVDVAAEAIGAEREDPVRADQAVVEEHLVRLVQREQRRKMRDHNQEQQHEQPGDRSAVLAELTQCVTPQPAGLALAAQAGARARRRGVRLSAATAAAAPAPVRCGPVGVPVMLCSPRASTRTVVRRVGGVRRLALSHSGYADPAGRKRDRPAGSHRRRRRRTAGRLPAPSGNHAS